MAMDTIRKEIATWSFGFKKPYKSTGMVALATVVVTKNSRSGSEATNYAVNQLLLDAVVGQRAAILELLACKDQALLIWSSATLITLP